MLKKLTACQFEDKTTFNKSDKDTSSPVLLDRPIESCTLVANSFPISDTDVNDKNDPSTQSIIKMKMINSTYQSFDSGGIDIDR